MMPPVAMRTTSAHFAIFLLIGAMGTAVHFVVLAWLSEGFDLGPVMASQVGALAGAAVNYVLNHRVNYRSGRSHLHTGPRFATVVVVGFLVNGLCMVLATRMWGWHYLPAQILATAVVLGWNFAANHWWTFHVRR